MTKAITHIFQLPWWDRVWVIQEVAVARQAWVIFGSDVLGFEYLRDFYHTVNKLDKITDSDVATGYSLYMTNIMLCTNERQSVLKAWLDDETSLLAALKLLFVEGNTQATDPRDVFYALIGLRVDVEAIVGKVDYSLPWQRLYTKAARSLLQEHCLTVLSYCSPARERQDNGLPSWVPDWRELIRTPLSIGWPTKMYSACGKTSQPPMNGNGAKELIVSGVVAAKILELRARWPLPPVKHNTHPWGSAIIAMKAWNQNINNLG